MEGEASSFLFSRKLISKECNLAAAQKEDLTVVQAVENGFLSQGFHFEGYWDSVNTNHQLQFARGGLRNSAGNKPWGQEPGCGFTVFHPDSVLLADNPVQETIPFSDQDPTHTSLKLATMSRRKISRQEVLFIGTFFLGKY